MHLFPLHLLEFCSREQPLDTVEPECAGAAARKPPCPAAGSRAGCGWEGGERDLQYLLLQPPQGFQITLNSEGRHPETAPPMPRGAGGGAGARVV